MSSMRLRRLDQKRGQNTLETKTTPEEKKKPLALRHAGLGAISKFGRCPLPLGPSRATRCTSAGAEAKVRALLRGGADCDGRVGPDVAEARRRGTTPLIVAAREGHVGAINILLEAGARVDLVKAGGATALLIAMHTGSWARCGRWRSSGPTRRPPCSAARRRRSPRQRATRAARPGSHAAAAGAPSTARATSAAAGRTSSPCCARAPTRRS